MSSILRYLVQPIHFFIQVRIHLLATLLDDIPGRELTDTWDPEAPIIEAHLNDPISCSEKNHLSAHKPEFFSIPNELVWPVLSVKRLKKEERFRIEPFIQGIGLQNDHCFEDSISYVQRHYATLAHSSGDMAPLKQLHWEHMV
jgi:hypothetical protein